MEDNKIIIANSSNVNSNWFSEGLSEYAAGNSCDKIKKVLDFIAPEVKVPRAFEYRKNGTGNIKYDVTELEPSEDATCRMTHCLFREVQSSSDMISARCNRYGFTTIIEDDDEDFQKQAVDQLKLRLLTEDLIRAVKLLESLSGKATVKVWKHGNANDPIKDVKALIAAVGDDSANNANKVLYGSGAWNKGLEYFGTDSANYTLAPANLALSLGLDGIVVSNDRALVRTKKGDTETLQKEYLIPENKVFAFASSDTPSAADFSVMKRFVAKPFQVLTREIAGGLEITLFTCSLIAQTGVGAVKAYSISAS